jgi:drug/metabolite transporter (DMT)-like permease
MTTQVKGALLMLLAMLSFSASSALAKVACEEVSFSHAVLFRGIVGVIALGAYARWRGVSLAGRRRGLLLARGALGTGAMLMYFYALTSIPVADAMLLNQATPIFVLPMAALFLRERVTWRLILLVAVALIGAAMVIRPSGQMVNVPGLVALGSAVLAAGAYVLVRELTRTESSLTIVFWFTAITVLVSAPLALQTTTAMGPDVMVALVGVGIFGVVGQLLLTAAYRKGEAGRLAAVGSFGALLGVGWDAVLWGHLPDLMTAAGGLVVILSCAAIQLLRDPRQKAAT